MGVIRLPFFFEGSKGDKILNALFDSGATFSYINKKYVGDIEQTNKLRRPFEVDIENEGYYMKVEEALRADFYFNDVRMSDEFMVVTNLSEEAIIGVTTMQKWRMKLDFEHDNVIVDPKIAKAILKQLK